MDQSVGDALPNSQFGVHPDGCPEGLTDLLVLGQLSFVYRIAPSKPTA